jgi:hypothetical protein
MTGAQVDFGPVMRTAGAWGFMFLLAWMVVSKTVVLNVIIAVLNDAYTKALDSERNQPGETTYEKIARELNRRRLEGFKVAALSSTLSAAKVRDPHIRTWSSTGRVLLLPCCLLFFFAGRCSQLLHARAADRESASARDRERERAREAGRQGGSRSEAAMRRKRALSTEGAGRAPRMAQARRETAAASTRTRQPSGAWAGSQTTPTHSAPRTNPPPRLLRRASASCAAPLQGCWLDALSPCASSAPHSPAVARCVPPTRPQEKSQIAR